MTELWRKCPECNGSGRMTVYEQGPNAIHVTNCTVCGHLGFVPADPAPTAGGLREAIAEAFLTNAVEANGFPSMVWGEAPHGIQQTFIRQADVAMRILRDRGALPGAAERSAVERVVRFIEFARSLMDGLAVVSTNTGTKTPVMEAIKIAGVGITDDDLALLRALAATPGEG